MKKFLKENWKFLLLVLFAGLIGGYCTGLYMYDSFSEELLKELQEQNITKEMISISTMFQYGILYGIILATIGIILSKKVKLWNGFKLNKKSITITLIFSLIGALLLFPGDKLIFGSFSSWVNEQYIDYPTIEKIISDLLVGGVIEEVMMRLFVMSFLIFITSKIFYRNNKEIPVKVYIISNIISSILFAALHLPSTAAMTTLTPLLIIRCFLFNGGLGLSFGFLYRKYGIEYAMISHGLCHFISDLLMLIII